MTAMAMQTQEAALNNKEGYGLVAGSLRAFQGTPLAEAVLDHIAKWSWSASIFCWFPPFCGQFYVLKAF